MNVSYWGVDHGEEIGKALAPFSAMKLGAMGTRSKNTMTGGSGMAQAPAKKRNRSNSSAPLNPNRRSRDMSRVSWDMPGNKPPSPFK